MTPCERLRQGLADGDPALLTDPTLRDHLAGCASCTAAAAADAALRQALAALARPSLSPDLRRRLTTLAAAPGPAALPALRGGDGDKGRPTAPFRAGADARPPRSGRPAAVPGRRERLLALLLLAACLAGLAFALRRLRPLPADRDGTPRPSPTAPTREASGPSPSAPAATAWPSPPPPLPPLPTVLDDSLALPEGALVVLRDEAGLLLFRGAEPGRRLLEDERVRSFKISPDGRWVAYETFTYGEAQGPDLWVLGVTGDAPRRIVDAAELARRLPPTLGPAPTRRTEIDSDRWAWVPGSDGLVYGTWEQDTAEPMSWRANDDLWVQALAGGPARMVLEAGKGGRIVYSPDGLKAVIIRESVTDGTPYHSISVADGTPHNLSSVAGPTREPVKELLRLAPIGTDSSWSVHPEPRWAPDSQSLLLALTRAAADHSGWAYPDEPAPLIRLQLDGSYRVVGPAVAPGLRDRYNGLWSPDGKAVAYFQPLALPAPTVTYQATRVALAQVGKVAGAYPPPAAGTVEPVVPTLLRIADVDQGAGEVYDQVTGQASELCWSPSGRRFAYQVDGQQWRLGSRGNRPRSLALPTDACYWLSDELLLIEGGDGVHLQNVDAHQRPLWQGGKGQAPILEVHLPTPPGATPQPSAENLASGDTPTETLRTFAAPALLGAAHIGAISFTDDGSRGLAMAWQAADLPGEAPARPAIGDVGDWPAGQVWALDLERGTGCLAATAEGRAVPAREDAAFRQARWLYGGHLVTGNVAGDEGLFWLDETCAKQVKAKLPGDEAPAAIVGMDAHELAALVATRQRFVMVEGGDGPWSNARPIDGLTPVDWAIARWSPSGQWLALLGAAAQPTPPGSERSMPALSAQHELVLVDLWQEGSGSPLVPVWRVPVRLRMGMANVITHVDWLTDEALLLGGANGMPDSVLHVDGRRQTVAELIGAAADKASDLEADAISDPSSEAFHLLIYPGDDHHDRLLYHSETQTTESLGVASLGHHFTEDGHLAWRSDPGNRDSPLLTRPIDPSGGQPSRRAEACGASRADALARSWPSPERVAIAPRYVELRPEGHIALRDVQTCALSDLVAIDGVSYVQQAQLSPDNRYLLVAGGSGELDTLGLHLVDLLNVAVSAAVRPAETPVPRKAVASAETDPSVQGARLAHPFGSLPYPSADWEPAPTAEPNRGPVLRSRSVQGCQVSLGGGREWGGPGQAYDAGQYTALIERSNGFGAAYVLEANDAEASFDGRILEARFTPQTWAACDRAVRRMIEGLP